MFGLAAIAAVAAMAFVGASSATAQTTVLCDQDINLACAAGHALTGPVHIEALAENPQLLTSFGNVHCEHSIILGSTNNTLASPLAGTVTSLSFTGCLELTFNTSCTATQVSGGTSLLLKTAANLGTLESHGSQVNVTCSKIGLNCTYGGLPVLHVQGSQLLAGEPTDLAIATANTTLTKTGGTFCPSTSTWEAEYEVLLPDPLFITN